ncbi:hypothetical protein Q9L58_005291 [Maublancomyces gigas]|uniref:Uncharacterized protein n=1 Tax=Discina gigas TaxID=1032678 RepID=A0ABR3GIJ0_9PEZI
MSKPSAHSRSKSASDVRRTLFRTLARSGASSSATNLASNNLATDIPAAAAAAAAAAPAESAEDREDRIASEDIVARRNDGSMDIEVPLTSSEHIQLSKELERESEVHMKWSADDHLKRHPEELKQRLPELLRMHVLSIEQDSWIFEPDEGY